MATGGTPFNPNPRSRIAVGRGRALRGPGVGPARALPGPRMGVGRGRALRPPTPPPAAAPGPTAMPWDARAQRESNAAGLNEENSLAGVQGNWQRQQEDFGLGDYANNPYSQAAMLQRQAQIGQRQVMNNAGRHLYGGITIARGRGVQGAYDRGRSALETRYAEAQEAAKQREAEAIQKQQEATGQIQEGAIERATAVAPPPAAVGPTKANRARPRQQIAVGRGRRAR